MKTKFLFLSAALLISFASMAHFPFCPQKKLGFFPFTID